MHGDVTSFPLEKLVYLIPQDLDINSDLETKGDFQDIDQTPFSPCLEKLMFSGSWDKDKLRHGFEIQVLGTTLLMSQGL